MSIAPLIFYGVETTLLNEGKVIGYSFMFFHGKIACEDRYLNEGHLLLCLFFFLQCNASHKRKFKMFHECLKVMFQPPKDMSFKFFISNLFLNICVIHLDM